MEVPIEIKTLFSYDHRILKIKNFEITILKIDEKNNTSVEESRSHIKYTIIKEHQGVNIVLERIDSGEKYKIRLPTEDDATNLINSINAEKTNYETFMKDYYTNNDSYNLIEGESFFDYFKSIINFLTEMEQSIAQIRIDENLEQILNVQNKFLEKITYYTKVIDTNVAKLYSENEEEINLQSRSKEIKTLLEELKDVIKACTYGLTCEEIEEYINNFKNLVKQKTKEIIMLIDEIKYNLANYLALKTDNPDEKAYGEVFTTKEEEVAKLLLENENLKIQIENLEIENDIINHFLIEHKY